MLTLLLAIAALRPGVYWNKVQGPSSFTISPSLAVSTSVTINNIGSGEKAKLSFPEPLQEMESGDYVTDGDFAMTYWGDFGMTRCWFSVQLTVRTLPDNDHGIETVFRLPLRYGVDKFGSCYEMGFKRERMIFFEEMAVTAR